MEEKNINCFVLDAVLEDYHPVWEILSVLNQRLSGKSESRTIDLLVDSLSLLFDSNCIAMYEGYKFHGEQKLIDQFKIDKQFVMNHKDDWKNKEYQGIDYRIAITDKGIEFLDNNCSSDLFKI